MRGLNGLLEATRRGPGCGMGSLHWPKGCIHEAERPMVSLNLESDSPVSARAVRALRTRDEVRLGSGAVFDSLPISACT
eukprot:67690-Ditylum_brightwellii.AAC.1